jgi:hypothetical protein
MQDIFVNVSQMSRQPQDNSCTFHYRINGGQFATGTITRLAANQYKASLPQFPCNTNVEYYFTASTTAPALQQNNPFNAPNDLYYVPVAFAINTVFSDDFEQDQGWSGVDPQDNATTGRWTRDIPQPTAAQPGTDHTPNGVKCWVTDYRAGQQVSDFDVDGGHTTLTSPRIDVSGLNSPRIGYWRWYSNNVGTLNPNTNIFYIDISNDDGVSWHSVEQIGPAGDGTGGGWIFHAFNVETYVPATNAVRIRFIAEDITDSIVEAAIDDFIVTALDCTPQTNPCYANCDQSTTPPILNIGDFICFQQAFASGASYANCDQSTTPPVLNIADFICFQQSFANGCH